MISSFAKGLSVLDFFAEGRISAHLDDIVEMLGTSKATAYRYLATLCDAGLLAPTAGGVYVLGPRIVELDRLMRIGDPMIVSGSKVMQEVSAKRKLNMMLASYYRDSIMCVDIAWPDESIPANFERGRPMSMFRGAMAKIILAHLSPYQLRNLMLNDAAEIRSAGLGANWTEFRANLSAIARQGYAITKEEMMAGAGGISAPIFDSERKVLGSITFALAESKWDSTDFERLRRWILEAAERVTAMVALETDAASIERPAPVSTDTRDRGLASPRANIKQESERPLARKPKKAPKKTNG